MKLTLTAAGLLATPLAAYAHTQAVPHVHGSDAVFFGAALVLLVGALAWLRSR
ncbi:MAG: hypothetical protein ACU0GG_09500 [Paracoccaceae bacterium]